MTPNEAIEYIIKVLPYGDGIAYDAIQILKRIIECELLREVCRLCNSDPCGCYPGSDDI